MSAPLPVTATVCRDFNQSSQLEWLETNGTGAFAMGTVAGVNTRRYHALLTASLNPPVARCVLLSRVDERVELDGQSFDLGACQYPGVVAPRGYEFLVSFASHPAPRGHSRWDWRSKSTWFRVAKP